MSSDEHVRDNATNIPYFFFFFSFFFLFRLGWRWRVSASGRQENRGSLSLRVDNARLFSSRRGGGRAWGRTAAHVGKQTEQTDADARGQSVILILRQGMIDLCWYENYTDAGHSIRPRTRMRIRLDICGTQTVALSVAYRGLLRRILSVSEIFRMLMHCCLFSASLLRRRRKQKSINLAGEEPRFAGRFLRKIVRFNVRASLRMNSTRYHRARYKAD